jgi:hypothetical protein
VAKLDLRHESQSLLTSRRGSERKRKLVFLVVLAGLVVACLQGPVPQVNVGFEVFNQSGTNGSYRWDGSGTSGSGLIRPCTVSDTSVGLGPGTWNLTITGSAGPMSFVLVSPPTGVANEVFSITPEGQVEHLYRLTGEETPPPRPSGC